MPGLKTKAEKHQAVGEAILEALRSSKTPLTFEQLKEEVQKRIPDGVLSPNQSLDWYAKTVQLDLEHEGKIERLDNPLRFRIPSGAKRTLRQVYNMKATPQQIWEMLVDAKSIESWSGAPAIMDDKAGTKFSLWDGSIHGENLEVVPERKLVQRWQEENWKESSTVTFNIRKKEPGVTTVELIQVNIPADKLEDIVKGWDEYYLGVIKRSFG